MIDRRQLLTVGGLLGALSPAPPEEGIGTAVGQMTERQAQEIANAIQGVTTAILRQQNFDAVIPIRNRQNDYLRANGKFPDFIDVALDVWTNVYDWHVRMQQPLVLGRDVNGRYTLMLGFTALVLRQDNAPGFVGIPYDNR
jgi:hypothetical protein